MTNPIERNLHSILDSELFTVGKTAVTPFTAFEILLILVISYALSWGLRYGLRRALKRRGVGTEKGGVSVATRVRMSELREAVWTALQRARVTIAFPQVDVHFDEPVAKGLAALGKVAA